MERIMGSWMPMLMQNRAEIGSSRFTSIVRYPERSDAKGHLSLMQASVPPQARPLYPS